MMSYSLLRGAVLCALLARPVAASSGSVTLMTGYDLSWTIVANEKLSVTITAQTTGWVGFGFSSSGGMNGGDMLMASVDDSTGIGSIGDYW